MSTDDKDTAPKDAPATGKGLIPSMDTPDDMIKSNHTTCCIHCGKQSKMQVVKNADPLPWVVRMLLNIFSPGCIGLDKHYQCPQCGRHFTAMSVWEAIVAPMLLVAFMGVLLLGFFWFVFVIVPAR